MFVPGDRIMMVYRSSDLGVLTVTRVSGVGGREVVFYMNPHGLYEDWGYAIHFRLASKLHEVLS